MEKQTFHGGGFIRVFSVFMITAIIVFIGFSLLESLLVHLFWLIFMIDLIRVYKHSVVIEHEFLKYETFIATTKISLENVSKITFEQLDRTTKREAGSKYSKVINIIDDTGRSAFVFPYHFISRKKSTERFIQAIHATHPGIRIYLDMENDSVNKRTSNINEQSQ